MYAIKLILSILVVLTVVIPEMVLQMVFILGDKDTLGAEE